MYNEVIKKIVKKMKVIPSKLLVKYLMDICNLSEDVAMQSIYIATRSHVCYQLGDKVFSSKNAKWDNDTKKRAKAFRIFMAIVKEYVEFEIATYPWLLEFAKDKIFIQIGYIEKGMEHESAEIYSQQYVPLIHRPKTKRIAIIESGCDLKALQKLGFVYFCEVNDEYDFNIIEKVKDKEVEWGRISKFNDEDEQSKDYIDEVNNGIDLSSHNVSNKRYFVSSLNKDTNDSIRTPHLESSEFILNRIKALDKRQYDITKIKNISELPEDTKIEIIENTTQILMAFRCAYLNPNKLDYYENRKKFVGDLNIVIGNYQDIILRISLPPLIGRLFKGSYDIYHSLKYALEEFYSHTNLPLVTNKKLLLIYKRYATNLTGQGAFDNDNWESKKTTNAISESINHSDNPKNFSFLYTAVESDTDLVEATLIFMEDFPNFFEYLHDTFPSQPLK